VKKILLLSIFLSFTLTLNAGELNIENLESAFKPTFISREGKQSAGTAFVVEYNNQHYAVTAHHLFSEAGGFTREYNWKELQNLVSGVSIQSLSNSKIIYSAHKATPIKGAKSVSNWSGKNDIAVFKLKTKPSKFLKLAESKPKIGEAVWLYGLVYNRPSAQLLHKATVVEYSKNWISYKFFDSELLLNGTSGAAILNENGEVLGINLSPRVATDGATSNQKGQICGPSVYLPTYERPYNYLGFC